MNAEEIKKLVAEDALRIELHDKIADQAKKIRTQLNSDNFSVDQETSDEEFKRRVKKYEELTADLTSSMIIVSYWGSKVHLPTILLPFRLLSGANKKRSGKNFWLALRWYPILELYYYVGISLLAAKNFNFIKQLCDIEVPNPYRSQSKAKLNQVLFGITDNFGTPFKHLFESQRIHNPLHDYLYQQLSSILNDLLYLEMDYETYFDEFEILTGLEYAHQRAGESPDQVYFPSGRFVYKYHVTNNPFSYLLDKATSLKKNWPPIEAGFFNGDYKRFLKIASLLEESIKYYR